MHGEMANSISNPYGRNCQAFMSEYCANNWDGACEFASQQQKRDQPNNLQQLGTGSNVVCNGITTGEVLLANTAAKKYMSNIGGTCGLKTEPFDPTVASSPMITFFTGAYNSQGTEGCVPEYEVNPVLIDDDIVMNKILSKPIIAFGVLTNIYNTAKRKGTLQTLEGTKLYRFFMSSDFQNYIMSTTPEAITRSFQLKR
jgi:hypothetical protein